MHHRKATRAVRVGQYQDLSDAHGEPVAMTSAYVFASAAEAAARFSGAVPGNVYSRFTNPTVRAFEQRLAAMEGAEDCVAFASGMAAITAIAHARLEAGCNLVCSRDVFGTTLAAFRRYFGKLGIDVRVVGLTQLDQWRASIDEQTRLVFIETPSNPLQQVGDIGAIASIAHAVGAVLVVDNTMLTPIFQKPLRLGADLVVHSAGKYIDGQGRTIAGAVLGSERLMDEMRCVRRSLGSTLGPMNAWLLLKSIETLELRVSAIDRSAGQLASRARGQAKLGQVHYTGLADHPQRSLERRQQSGYGGVLSFEVGRNRDEAWRWIDALELVSIATNIGDTRSMVTHPGHHHPLEAFSRGAPPGRDQRSAGAAVRRPGARGRSDRRPRACTRHAAGVRCESASRRAFSAAGPAVSLILKLALIGCVAAPLLAAAFNSSRAAVAGPFYAAALLAALIGMHIDPLAMGLSRVDDAMTASVCGLGLRPLR